MITNLLGRKVEPGYGGDGTIVAVYIDRGEVKVLIENPDNGLWETGATSLRLKEQSCQKS